VACWNKRRDDGVGVNCENFPSSSACFPECIDETVTRADDKSKGCAGVVDGSVTVRVGPGASGRGDVDTAEGLGMGIRGCKNDAAFN
jgi:hypothetical protein